MFNHELGFYANLMLHLNIILTHFSAYFYWFDFNV